MDEERYDAGVRSGEQVWIRIELAVRLVKTGAGHFYADIPERSCYLCPVPLDRRAEHLHEVGMGQNVEEAAAGCATKRSVVSAPGFVYSDLLDQGDGASELPLRAVKVVGFE